MRSFFIFVLVMTLSLDVLARDWVKVNKWDILTNYYDRETVSSDGLTIEVIILQNYDFPQRGINGSTATDSSLIARLQFDCRRQIVTIKEMQLYTGLWGRGDITTRFRPDPPQFDPPSPGTTKNIFSAVRHLCQK